MTHVHMSGDRIQIEIFLLNDIPAKRRTGSPQMESQLGAYSQPTTVLPERAHHQFSV